MKVAVLSLTRDRLDYTKHCFERLRELAGCEFDHYVLDQGSGDGTKEWLKEEFDSKRISIFFNEPVNVGISIAFARLVNTAQFVGYDVIVKFDNDCEIVTPNCLRDVARATVELNALLSPTILGLRYPPIPTHSSTFNSCWDGGSWKVNHVGGNIGGIFLSAPAGFYDGWQLEGADDLPVWGMDDVKACRIAHERKMVVGYLDGYEANHHETTDGQHSRYPAYFTRRISEGGPP